MGFYLYSASVKGPGHMAENMPNQDDVITRQWNNEWMAVVSDGMGSRKHAKAGSMYACQAVQNIIQKSSFDIPSRDLIFLVYKQWLAFLGFIKPDDAATTCLIAWGKNSGETRLFQLGDGLILYEANESGQLSYRKNNQFSNETIGLGISRKFSDWAMKEILINKKNQGLALMTDGIGDDLIQTNLFVHYMIRTLRNMKKRQRKRWMINELENWPTPGHIDDKTIAIIYRK